MAVKREKEPAVPLVRYESPTRLGEGTFGLLIIVVAVLLAVIVARSEVITLSGLIVCVLVLWAYSWYAIAMETRPDGLLVEFSVGGSRLIPYTAIRQVALRGGHNAVMMYVYTRDGFWPSSLWIGRYEAGAQPEVDDLVVAINKAAHLTRFSRTMFGHPTYEREA